MCIQSHLRYRFRLQSKNKWGLREGSVKYLQSLQTRPLQENMRILMAEIVRNSSVSFRRKKDSSEFRQTFRRLTDEYRETSFWRTFDDIPMRTHETRVHRKNYIPTEHVPRTISTNRVLGKYRRTIVRRNFPRNLLRRYFPRTSFVGIIRRPQFVGIYQF